jgi:hypothetical protein
VLAHQRVDAPEIIQLRGLLLFLVAAEIAM